MPWPKRFSSWGRAGPASRRWHVAWARASACRSYISMLSTGMRAGSGRRLAPFVNGSAAGDAWVMDGNYSAHLDLRLSRTEAVIWLDLPRHIYFPRAVWRSMRNYGRERDDLGPGCPEQFDLSFLMDWVWNYKTRSRAQHGRLMSSLPAGIRAIVLRSPHEVRQFENGLPHSLDLRAT